MSTRVYTSRFQPYYAAITLGGAIAATTLLELPQWADRTIWIAALVLASLL
ncbi:MAG: hypothetical protein GAK28_04367 [Luteibacter sp.]|uniref:hypothetical protein n=1 Tax=Luteibacter sp. TaxID=1886636 RepID=UPI001385CA14|nr:hypothetical protein [Luteibacter sp.]KAF1003904.1 MAG: hypothetical protein GAK28_04367 [Luteibacter sp.]